MSTRLIWMKDLLSRWLEKNKNKLSNEDAEKLGG